jgi:DNA-directed RNA polymerase specialized sigma24 family protein
MNFERRTLLVRVMAGLATGDQAFVFALCDHFGRELRGVVRTTLTEFGRHELASDPDEVHDLVFEVADELARCAAAWRADGALPWRWADRAVRSRIGRAIGHRGIPLDDERAVAAAKRPAPEPVTPLVYEDLMVQRPELGVFDAALRRLASARDHDIVVEYLVQQAYDDPSPSHTVAAQFGIGAPAVRQVVSRALRRVKADLPPEGRPDSCSSGFGERGAAAC